MTIESLWFSNQASIKAFLHTKISSTEDVEELLQEVALRAFMNIDTLKSEDKARAWLFRIAHNLVIDFYRKKHVQQCPHPDDLWYADPFADPEHVFSPCIEPLLRDLPEDIADLIYSIDIQRQSQKAYAARLGISYSTFKSRVQKARKMLYGLFHEYCEISLDRRGQILDFSIRPDKSAPCSLVSSKGSQAGCVSS